MALFQQESTVLQCGIGARVGGYQIVEITHGAVRLQAGNKSRWLYPSHSTAEAPDGRPPRSPTPFARSGRSVAPVARDSRPADPETTDLPPELPTRLAPDDGGSTPAESSALPVSVPGPVATPKTGDAREASPVGTGSPPPNTPEEDGASGTGVVSP